MSYNFPSGSQAGFTLGQNTIYASTSDNLNTLVSNVSSAGGGTIYLGAGTYVLSSAVTGKSRVSIVGISPSATTVVCASSSKNFSFAGTGVYTTGTITSITSGVNVTGSGTSWLANASAGQYLFLGTRWYLIGAVLTNTTLTLAEGYGDNITFPGAAYRIATPIIDVTLANFTITGSTGTGIEFTDALDLTLTNVISASNNKGFTFTNVSRAGMTQLLAAGNTASGFEYTNVGLCNWQSINSASNGSNGFTFNNVKTINAVMSATANTGDGFNWTTVVDAFITLEASGNGGQGVEMVADCNGNIIDGVVNGNTSDGVKLTSNDDNNFINGLQVVGNGAWGIDIANANCNTNILVGVNAASNSSGSLTDSGTGTLASTTVNVLP